MRLQQHWKVLHMAHQLRWVNHKNLGQFVQRNHRSWEQRQRHLEIHKMIGKLLKESDLEVNHMNLEMKMRHLEIHKMTGKLMKEPVPEVSHMNLELQMRELVPEEIHKSPGLGMKLRLEESHKSLELELEGIHKSPDLGLKLLLGEIHKSLELGLLLNLVEIHKNLGLGLLMIHNWKVSWKNQMLSHKLKVLG